MTKASPGAMASDGGQMRFDFDAPRVEPNWDDVHGGSAVLSDRLIQCQRAGCQFWNGIRCRSVSGEAAHPKSRPGGMCLAHFIEWR